MIFTSFEFIAFFLIVLIGYYLIFPNLRWIWLLAASFYFYTKASPHFLPYILSSVAVIYASSRMIGYLDSRKASYFQKNELTKDEKKAYNKRCTRNKKIFCAAGIILNVGMLAFTKYFNFVGESVSAITGGTFTALDIIVPLGISFYTFQSTGYLIDVYRGMYEPQKNPMKYALFILFFPQIMQGPIGRYNDLAPQLFEPCKFDYARLKSGLVRMLWGFFKKMVIADRAALLVNTVFDNWKPYSGAVIWVAVFLYAVQLYADFSGGIDISRGVSQLFGIDLAENFRRPYFSRNISEYWHRWHITLGAWLREYLFYPIAMSKLFQKFGRSLKKHFGMKISKVLPVSIASLITFIVVGIWHGAYWRYVGFGLWNGLIIMVSTLLEDKYAVWKKTLHIRDTNKLFILFQMFRTFLIVLVGYYFDIAPGFTAALKMMWLSITDFHISELADPAIFDALGVSSASLILVAIAVFALLVCSIVQECSGRTLREMICSKGFWAEAGVFLLLFWVVAIFGVYGPGTNPAEFVYMQF